MIYQPINNDLVDEPIDGEEEYKESHKHQQAPLVLGVFIILLLGVLIGATVVAWRQNLRSRIRVDDFQATFSNNLTFMSLDHEFDSLWDIGQMIDFARLRMQDDKTSDADMPATVSMLHQLHCLSALRNALQRAHDGEQIAFDFRDDGHWPHCLDYLRNTIMCNADATIEIPAMINGRRKAFVDGSGVQRQCKSTDAVFAIFRGEDKRFNVTQALSN